jgi:undecaprenyl-diphosphatase
MDLLHAIVIAIVEGLTEFIPVSSTGHMILVSFLFNISEEDFTKTFQIFIQLGAILAIIFLYSKRFLQGLNIYYKLAVAFLPTGILGLIMYKFVKTYLFNHWIVAISLIVGGIVLIYFDRTHKPKEDDNKDLTDISYKNAFFIGLIQSLSMIPGVSRSAATIIGGMALGLTKKHAAEFSFLLAVPTMMAAAAYDLYKWEGSMSLEQIQILAIGFVIAFVTAIIAVKAFLALLEKFGFQIFGIYRIIIGLLFILFALNVM